MFVREKVVSCSGDVSFDEGTQVLLFINQIIALQHQGRECAYLDTYTYRLISVPEQGRVEVDISWPTPFCQDFEPSGGAHNDRSQNLSKDVDNSNVKFCQSPLDNSQNLPKCLAKSPTSRTYVYKFARKKEVDLKEQRTDKSTNSSSRLLDARMLPVRIYQFAIIRSRGEESRREKGMRSGQKRRLASGSGEEKGVWKRSLRKLIWWRNADRFRTAARIKRNKKSSQVKFKVRCQRHLYTLVLKDTEKVEKLKQSLPPSTFISQIRPHILFSEILPYGLYTQILMTNTALTITETPKKNAKGKRVA
jgi:hypothetical protein